MEKTRHQKLLNVVRLTAAHMVCVVLSLCWKNFLGLAKLNLEFKIGGKCPKDSAYLVSTPVLRVAPPLPSPVVSTQWCPISMGVYSNLYDRVLLILWAVLFSKKVVD